MNIIDTIKENKIFAVIRNADEEQIIKISSILNECNINLLEITMENKNSLEVFKTAKKYQKYNQIIGAGTVLDVNTAKLVIQEGCQFIVSPIMDENIINICKKNNVICIIGALTPTEIYKAYYLGADFVKVFPANSLGYKYLKDISNILSYIPLIPTGGINIDNIKNYFNATNVAIGVGNSLVNTSKLITNEDYEELKQRASKFSEALN